MAEQRGARHKILVGHFSRLGTLIRRVTVHGTYLSFCSEKSAPVSVTGHGQPEITQSCPAVDQVFVGGVVGAAKERTNHPPQARRRGLILHLPATDCRARELGFYRATRYVSQCVTM